MNSQGIANSGWILATRALCTSLTGWADSTVWKPLSATTGSSSSPSCRAGQSSVWPLLPSLPLQLPKPHSKATNPQLFGWSCQESSDPHGHFHELLAVKEADNKTKHAENKPQQPKKTHSKTLYSNFSKIREWTDFHWREKAEMYYPRESTRNTIYLLNHKSFINIRRKHYNITENNHKRLAQIHKGKFKWKR